MKRSCEELMDGRQIRRMKAEDRFLDKMERQERAAESLIGELIREGKKIYYVNFGRKNYTENASYFDMVDFLVRNKYI